VFVPNTVDAGGRSTHLAISPLGGKKNWLDGCWGNESTDAVIVFVIGGLGEGEITAAEDENYLKLEGRERCSLPFIIDPRTLGAHGAS